MNEPILVSACLLGLATRYDGQSKPDPFLIDLLSKKYLIPVCPEQLGGLPTPRVAAEIVGGDGLAVWMSKAKVLNKKGEDVTMAFCKGAKEVLRLAKLLGVKKAILKSRSPSCGISPKLGVTAARLLVEGIKIEEWG